MMKFQVFLLAALLILPSCGGPQVQDQKPTYGSGTTVAVWDLEDLSVVKQETLGSMQEFLTAKVIETLKAKGGFALIERQKLLLALEELNVGSSALAGETTRLEVGRILGARLMVFGGYQLVGQQVRIDLRMVDVETGAVVKASEKTVTSADISGWLMAAEEAALELI